MKRGRITPVENLDPVLSGRVAQQIREYEEASLGHGGGQGSTSQSGGATSSTSGASASTAIATDDHSAATTSPPNKVARILYGEQSGGGEWLDKVAGTVCAWWENSGWSGTMENYLNGIVDLELMRDEDKSAWVGAKGIRFWCSF